MSSDPVPQTRHDVGAFRASWFMLAYFPRPAPLRADALRTCGAPSVFLSLHIDPLVELSPFPWSMQKNRSQTGKQTESSTPDLWEEQTFLKVWGKEEFYMPAIKAF